MTTDLKSRTVEEPSRWTASDASPFEGGGFVAYGDYLELARRLEEAQQENLRLKSEHKEMADDLEQCLLHRDQFADDLDKAQQKIVAQQAAVQHAINRIPAIVNGEMIIDHYDMEGEFVGSESVDPISVLGSVVGALESMDASSLAAHDAELTAKAKAEALEEVKDKCKRLVIRGREVTHKDCVDMLDSEAAEYRAKANGEKP